MIRNFGISMLLFGLLLAGIDGFRVRERAQAGSPSGTIGAGTSADVHFSEAGAGIFPPK
jgi:hypothetical protein